MKRILGLAALLGHALTAWTGIQFYGGARGGGKRQPAGRYRYSSKPTDARWGHDLEQPGQCARLQDAKDKRERRACKLHNVHARASSNPAHRTDYEFLPSGRLVGTTIPASLSPTYVAK